MVERKGERKETEAKGDVLVCNAVHEWSAPASHPNHKYIYVWDRASGEEYMTQCPVAEVAEWLHKGLHSVGLLSPTGEERQLFHDPPIRGFTEYLDGYWGRPLIPASFFSLHPLREEQIEELQTHLDRLRGLELGQSGLVKATQTQ